ncbi:MAG TPA: hypothetical protein VEA99_11635 [Gemmatimonadaceae bacterium]|nr:hypothetical protein [Gemmatimonadaceae bacterium]
MTRSRTLALALATMFAAIGCRTHDERADLLSHGGSWAEAASADIIRPGDVVPSSALDTASSDLRADLRRLAVAQELHFAERLTYAAAGERLAADWRPTTPEASITLEGDARGWSATIVVAGRPAPNRCGIFVGEGRPPHQRVTVEGTPACW